MNCSIQDTFGFMWFGTQGGVSRYGGYNVKNYYSDSRDTTMLSRSGVFNILEDRKKQLWVVYANELGIYNRSQDNFSTVLKFPDKITAQTDRLGNL